MLQKYKIALQHNKATSTQFYTDSSEVGSSRNFTLHNSSLLFSEGGRKNFSEIFNFFRKFRIIKAKQGAGRRKKSLGGAPSATRLGRRRKAASERRGAPKAFFSSLGPACLVNLQFFYYFQNGAGGFSAVGNRVFLVGGQFRHGFFVLRQVNDRVVAKAA